MTHGGAKKQNQEIKNTNVQSHTSDNDYSIHGNQVFKTKLFSAILGDYVDRHTDKTDIQLSK